MARAVASFRPDIIHIHGLWTFLSVVGVLVGRKLKIPRIVSPHGMLDPWAFGQSPIRKRLALATYEGMNLNGARFIHALCDAETIAVEKIGLTAPIRVVPNGVDVPERGMITGTAPWQSELPKNRRILLYLGRIHKKKGLDALIAGWSRALRCSNEGMQWDLVIAGWGDETYERELRRLVQELHVDRTVRFVGPQVDRAKDLTYACADAFILPSLAKGCR